MSSQKKWLNKWKDECIMGEWIVSDWLMHTTKGNVCYFSLEYFIRCSVIHCNKFPVLSITLTYLIHYELNIPVSYTHLDVYKRQRRCCTLKLYACRRSSHLACGWGSSCQGSNLWENTQWTCHRATTESATW